MREQFKKLKKIKNKITFSLDYYMLNFPIYKEEHIQIFYIKVFMVSKIQFFEWLLLIFYFFILMLIRSLLAVCLYFVNFLICKFFQIIIFIFMLLRRFDSLTVLISSYLTTTSHNPNISYFFVHLQTFYLILLLLPID